MRRRFTIYSVYLYIRKSVLYIKKLSIFLHQKTTFSSFFHFLNKNDFRDDFFISKTILDIKNYSLISKNPILGIKTSNS